MSGVTGTALSADQQGAGGEKNIQKIPIDRIKDGGAQMREDMKPDVVREYADEMAAGAIFPPIIVFHDGANYWLADGYHRVEAARKIERTQIDADVREGEQRDAILHGVGANAAHGLRRTQADKRRAVERLLKDDEWNKWSDRQIAKVAKVDHKTVGKIRREMRGEFPTQVALSGEIPRVNGKPTNSGLLDNVLQSIPTDDLIAECERRGLRVEASDA